MRLRFSIASLLAAIIFCGVGLAALHSASALWASTLFTVVVIVFSAAILGAMASRGRHRLTWAGLAIFGWIYLAIAFGPWPFNPDGPAPLLTVPLLDAIQDSVVSDGKTPYLARDHERPNEREMAIRGNVGPLVGNLMPPPPPGGYKQVSLVSYRQVGHTLGAALFGLIGALLGRFFAARNEAADRRGVGA
jgi:MFS family permease